MKKEQPDLGCQCAECRALFTETGYKHLSDCAVHSEPAYPNEKCNCIPRFAAYTEIRFIPGGTEAFRGGEE